MGVQTLQCVTTDRFFHPSYEQVWLLLDDDDTASG